jgi:hypothetical protein
MLMGERVKQYLVVVFYKEMQIKKHIRKPIMPIEGNST